MNFANPSLRWRAGYGRDCSSSPCKHGGAAGPGDLSQPAHEISPILVVIDDIAPFDTADHHMVEGCGI